MQGKDEAELEKLEDFFSFLAQEHFYVYEIFLQIQFLEDLQRQVYRMYLPMGKNFQYERKEHQKNVDESFDKFINELRTDLGDILENLFIKRDHLILNTKTAKEPNA